MFTTTAFRPAADARDGCRNATLVADGRMPRDVLAARPGAANGASAAADPAATPGRRRQAC